VFEIGDVAQGFREADVIVEREYQPSTVHQGILSRSATHYGTPMAASLSGVAARAILPSGTKRPDRGIPVSKVKVIPMEIGGGFGRRR